MNLVNLEDLTIGQAREIAAFFNGTNGGHPPQPLGAHLIGKQVIVRTYSAGVHFGTLRARSGTEVHLTAARRIWSWNKAFTLSKIAADGLDVASSKLSVFVSEIILTEAIEIIPVAEAVKVQLSTAPAHQPE